MDKVTDLAHFAISACSIRTTFAVQIHTELLDLRDRSHV